MDKELAALREVLRKVHPRLFSSFSTGRRNVTGATDIINSGYRCVECRCVASDWMCVVHHADCSIGLVMKLAEEEG